MNTSAALIALAALSPACLAQNLILNGSFEQNASFSTVYNLTNEQFNATVGSATAFGIREEIDLMDAGAPYGRPPQHGNWKLGIARFIDNFESDAFAFNLSGPIVQGQTYTLDFYAHAEGVQRPGRGPIEIGISASPTSFGTLIYTTPAVLSIASWDHFVHEFTAPIAAAYLTVRAVGAQSAWYHIDNFTLESAAGPCYPDCNLDALVNLADFGCFTTKFSLANFYADCNGDNMLNLADFGCFQTKFALGCP